MGVEQYAKLFVDLADMEEEYAENLKVLADRVRHPVIRALLLGIANDSKKHSMVYKAIVELITRYQPTISQEEFERLAEEISKHIETEAKMIEMTKGLMEQFKDPRVKLLLAAIHDDELEHHKVLTSIRDRIASEYMVSEEDVWNTIWRDSPWHGTPGG